MISVYLLLDSLWFCLYTKNALSDLHRRIAQATIQNTNTTKRDFVLKIKAFKDMNKNYLLFMFALNFNYP